MKIPPTPNPEDAPFAMKLFMVTNRPMIETEAEYEYIDKVRDLLREYAEGGMVEFAGNAPKQDERIGPEDRMKLKRMLRQMTDAIRNYRRRMKPKACKPCVLKPSRFFDVKAFANEMRP